MKYKIDEMISINNKEWRVAEYRMGRGREWLYLSFAGSFVGAITYTSFHSSVNATIPAIASNSSLTELNKLVFL